MEFCERLKAIRKEKGYKQKDIYAILKVSPNCYASWEQGRTEPDIKMLKRLCQIFNVTSDYLLGIQDSNF
ncbi:MAG TPA: transcriptional regulator [Clostridiales bacterium]|nr:transcriptional regulator [Clostridiales bacterium]